MRQEIASPAEVQAGDSVLVMWAKQTFTVTAQADNDGHVVVVGRQIHFDGPWRAEWEYNSSPYVINFISAYREICAPVSVGSIIDIESYYDESYGVTISPAKPIRAVLLPTGADSWGRWVSVRDPEVEFRAGQIESFVVVFEGAKNTENT